jgi:hypothetical protein
MNPVAGMVNRKKIQFNLKIRPNFGLVLANQNWQATNG